ncbi:MAG: APC family permease [Longibaculum muris]|uniref:APA family basic amino acid/polyamine antiporter n=1 Tax=Longibaculum muris TaxID=1796628 RepID=A0A4V2W4N5_9FIRM|nr:APC family permease [Longibaculum muris]MCR1888223.1 APC family permease [Longibaculum muris]MED9810501.1 APC family permease [Longibaculum muris]TCV96549.1 APA family basic amino acid/polyamine antiporter [Longibaculum muris]
MVELMHYDEKEDMMKKNKHEKYSLLTAITMIVGTCIGSGIFFKSDNILIATNGSIMLGVILFVLAAIAIIFGSLSVGELAAKTNEPGGLVTYAQEFVNAKTACGFGWFLTFIYYPTIAVVVSWVIGVYVDILFHLQASLELQMIIGFIFLSICFVYNILLPKLGAIFQDVSTFIKMLPLLLLGILGILFGDPLAGLGDIGPTTLLSSSWIMALGPIAYSYDGWIVATSIAHEVKDAKKAMPKALTIAPLIVLAIYTLYFVGITSYLGVDQVMALGDAHVSVAASALLGNTFAKMIVVFVIISVMGTVNGLVTGYMRMPYSLALRKGMFLWEAQLKKVDEKLDIPVYSAIFAFVVCTIWMVIHYLCTRFNILPNSDVSEIAISMAYMLYIVLYYQVYQLYRRKEIKSFFKGVICPFLATLGSFIILSGGMQSQYFIYYLFICGLVYLISQVYYHFHQK